MKISRVRYVAATAKERETGLLGWVFCVADDWLQISGVTLRRTRNGELTVSFPGRHDRRGEEHPYIRPLTDRARLDFLFQILSALGVEDAATR